MSLADMRRLTPRQLTAVIVAETAKIPEPGDAFAHPEPVDWERLGDATWALYEVAHKLSALRQPGRR